MSWAIDQKTVKNFALAIQFFNAWDVLTLKFPWNYEIQSISSLGLLSDNHGVV
jgi:hypothetical protein